MLPSTLASRSDGVQDTLETSLTPLEGSSPSEVSDAVLHAIVVNKGILRAASDWLKHSSPLHLDIPPLDMPKYLQGRLPELKEQMELVATLDLFSLMPIAHNTAMKELGNLEGPDATRAYMELMKLVQASVGKNELTINVHEEVWHRAPRDIQKAFALLEAAGKLDLLDDPSLIIDHMPSDSYLLSEERTS